MYISRHGGGCCGMSHIYDMGFEPNHMTSAVTKSPPSTVSSPSLQMQYERPAETRRQRLEALIESATHECAQIRDEDAACDCNLGTANRPAGILEVVLTQNQPAWIPVLKELGFKEVNRAVNSNSNNTIIVFHLNTNQEGLTLSTVGQEA